LKMLTCKLIKIVDVDKVAVRAQNHYLEWNGKVETDPKL
jgi:hypothetical protein